VKKPKAEPRETVHRILVAVDGSPQATKAVRLGAEIAKGLGADLVLVHVASVEEVPTLIAEAEGRDGEERAQLVLGDAVKVATAEGVEPKVVLLKGHAAAQILRYADEHAVQLILTGSRGVRGAKGVLMGSVSRAVSRRASCSVIIVR
jgi:nucleotide-binding universal stress UspA family protein